jgi:hypothetical protein
MQQKVKAKCASCGAECEKNQKPEPKSVVEKNQVDFICKGCGAANLRNGTARVKVEKAKKDPVARKKPATEPKKDLAPAAELKKNQIPEKPKGVSLLGWATVLAVTCLFGFLGFRVITGKKPKAPPAPGKEEKKAVDPLGQIT